MFSCVFITQQVLNLNGDSDFYNSPPLRYPAESCRTLRAQDPSKHSSLSMLKTCDASTSRITSRPKQHLSDTCAPGRFMVLLSCLMLVDNHGCREKHRKFTVTHSKCFHFFAWQQCTTSCEITSPNSNPEPACAVCFVRTCFKRWERSLGRLGSECTLESIPENSACWQRHCTCHISLPFSSISAERSWKLLLGQMKANPVETNESNQLRLLRSLGSTHNRTHKWVTGNDGGFLARWLQGSIMQQGIMKNHWKSWFFMTIYDNDHSMRCRYSVCWASLSHSLVPSDLGIGVEVKDIRSAWEVAVVLVPTMLPGNHLNDVQDTSWTWNGRFQKSWWRMMMEVMHVQRNCANLQGSLDAMHVDRLKTFKFILDFFGAAFK